MAASDDKIRVIRVFVSSPGDVQEEHEDWPGRRVVRGGSFSNDADLCRSAFRNWFGPDDRFYFIGFRVSRTYN